MSLQPGLWNESFVLTVFMPQNYKSNCFWKGCGSVWAAVSDASTIDLSVAAINTSYFMNHYIRNNAITAGHRVENVGKALVSRRSR